MIVFTIVTIAGYTMGRGHMAIDDTKESTFDEHANEVISIMDYVISNRTHYLDEERVLIEKFYDSQHSESQRAIKKELMGIAANYFGKINFKNYDDPKNEILVNELLPRLRQIREQIKAAN